MDGEEARAYLPRLQENILQTLARSSLEADYVIDACDALARQINEEEHLPLLCALGLGKQRAKDELRTAKAMLSRETLQKRMEIELALPQTQFTDANGLLYTHTLAPLGVLLHIAAGNAHGLPVYSVIEGLLCGNINLLKLPGSGDDISIVLIEKLIQIAPRLSEYIHVLNFPSSDVPALRELAAMADAAVVWGGDEAVRAVRALADVNMRIIEWGHRLSFAYIVPDMTDDTALVSLAQSICEADQLLCSSCQGIFIDTESMDVLHAFAQHFINILADVSAKYPSALPFEAHAKVTLEQHTQSMLSMFDGTHIYAKGGVSLHVMHDTALQSGMLMRNAWVKRLQREKILQTLKSEKGYLQSAALLCSNTDYNELCTMFTRTGIARIRNAKNIQNSYGGEPHDGEYPLRRYVRIVSKEERGN